MFNLSQPGGSLANAVYPPNSNPTYNRGQLLYDTTNEGLTFYNSDSGISLQIGQEEWVRVVNTSALIPNGSAVYISGSISGWPAVGLASAATGTTTIAIGLATEDIGTNSIGYVTNLGICHNLNTAAFTTGPIYLSATGNAGSLTQISPSAPNYRYRVGFVTVADAISGSILVTQSTASIGNGSNNQLLGISNTGSNQEWKTLQGTANQIGIAAASNSLTLSLPAAGVTLPGTIRLKSFLVSTLPTGSLGDVAIVTDALGPAFLVAVVGGGAIVTPVFKNSTTWVAF